MSMPTLKEESDVVERLLDRERAGDTTLIPEARNLIEQQRKRIEELEAGLRILADPNSYGVAIDVSTAPIKVKVSSVARALLGEKT